MAIPAVAQVVSSALQLSENDKARQYNSEEAAKQRAYNTWMLDNSTQLKANDARQAGLNPAFMNGSILGSTPVPAASPTSPSSTIPFDSSALLQGMKQESEIKNIDADTKKKEAENERQLIENTYLPQLMQSQIDVNFGDVRLKAAEMNLNNEQARMTAQKCLNLQKDVEVMNKKIELDTATISNIKEDIKLKLIDEFWKSKEYQAIINKLSSEASLNYTQADDIVKTRLARLYNLYSQGEYNYSQSEYTDKLSKGVDIQNGRLAIDLEMDEKYKEWDKWIDMSGKVVGSIADAANVFSKFTTKKVRTESKSTVESHSKSENVNTNHSMSDTWIHHTDK